MHIAAIPNRSARPTFLLRKSARKGKHVTSETLTNLSELSIAQIEAMRRVLKGEKLGPHGGDFECTGSKLHGHVDAVRTAMARLGFDKLIDAKASRSRGLVAAMVALCRHSRRATNRPIRIDLTISGKRECCCGSASLPQSARTNTFHCEMCR